MDGLNCGQIQFKNKLLKRKKYKKNFINFIKLKGCNMLETKVQRGFNKLAFILINNLKIKPEYDLEKSKVFLLYVQQSS